MKHSLLSMEYQWRGRLCCFYLVKIPKILNEVPIVLGIYGCDTAYNCPNPTKVAYPNTQGTSEISPAGLILPGDYISFG
jgi:hypothetical protein